MRKIIFHFHIFKNAGTTVDRILQRNFPEQWVNYDETDADAIITPVALDRLIKKNPGIAAFSSHQAVMPLPEIAECKFYPIVLLRHPLDRARSVYEFEAKQGQHDPNISKGAAVAANSNLEEYLRFRLDEQKNGVICNFQTIWFLGRRGFNNNAISDTEFEQAIYAMERFPFVGIVEHFDATMTRLKSYLSDFAPDLDINVPSQNVNKGRLSTLEERLANFESSVSADIWEEVVERNVRDLELYDRALQLLGLAEV